MIDFASVGSFMALGAHCDDVDVRVGGTFARFKREGKRGCYVTAIENAYVGPHYDQGIAAREALDMRHDETTRAAAILEADQVEWLKFKSYYFSTPERDVVLPTFNSLAEINEQLSKVVFEGLPPIHNAYRFPQCVERFVSLVDKAEPQIIMTNSPDDRHPDHYGLARFVDLVVGDLNNAGRNIQVLYQDPGSGGPMGRWYPDLLVELSESDIRKKQDASAVYASQFSEGEAEEHALIRAKQLGSLAGVDYAEGFCIGGAWHSTKWYSQEGFDEMVAARKARLSLLRLDGSLATL